MTTTFSISWSSTFETQPADNELERLGAGRIRDLKVAVRQRLDVDHSWVGDGNDGKHQQVQLRVSALDPTLDATDGCLYAKVVGGNTEAFFEDSAARVTQLTSLGALNTSAFPPGTQMLFLQASAPVGWTQVSAFNDFVLRVVGDGSGGLTGGSWVISGLFGSTSIASHALSSAEIPAHSHGYIIQNNTGTLLYAAGGQSLPNWQPGGANTDGGTGGGQGHTHGASTAINADGTWRPQYANVICCQKG